MFDIATHIPVSFKSFEEPRKYSLEEYLRKEAHSKNKHEFINGQIIRMPYAKGPHNIISANFLVSKGIENTSGSKEEFHSYAFLLIVA